MKQRDKPIKSSGVCGINILESEPRRTITVEEGIIPGSKILELLNNNQSVTRYLRQCRLNPNLELSYREDLEYYLPQLVCQAVLNKDDSILDFIVEAAEIDFFFAHTFFFAWRSLVSLKQPEIENYLKIYLHRMVRHYQDSLLIAAYFEEYEFKDQIQQVSKPVTNVKANIREETLTYGTLFYEQPHIVQADALKVGIYASDQVKPSGFCSTIDFWDDLIRVAQRLEKANPKIISLRADIQLINAKLPASIYIPFYSLRNYVVLNIVVNECRVFSTKTRSPYSLCIELYRPELEIQNNRLSRLSQARVVGKATQKQSIKQSITLDTCDFSDVQNRPTIQCQPMLGNILDSELKMDDELSTTYVEDLNRHIEEGAQKKEKKENNKELLKILFGIDQTKIIRQQSPFREFTTWRLAHVMVKYGDDLRQEQFALQIVSLFEQIFKQENLHLRLKPYSVISIGPGYGLIEMVQNAISIDSLKQKLQLHIKSTNLIDYFKLFQTPKQIHNFLYSLAAYSLLCYFMQVKDRHNGNIMLHKDGSIVHIDFGFFLSNLPGGALEKVPFKLLNEYIDVLGGANSSLFQRFRTAFYEGFKAIRKHQQQIMDLVICMKDSGFPCFKENSIVELRERFMPNVTKDSELYVACQKLIDKSIDHWRARWYDKYQYYFQGIFA